MSTGPGGYTLENARSALNLFLQKNRQPTDMQVELLSSDKMIVFHHCLYNASITNYGLM